MNDRNDLNLRKNVGIAVFNRNGHVMVCKRLSEGERRQTFHSWQMPQGGIDPGETAVQAAYRELHEETAITKDLIEPIAEMEQTVIYTYPPEVMAQHPHREFDGQSQSWVAFLFDGDDEDIDLVNCPDPSFDLWEWIPLNETIKRVVPFKQDVYKTVITCFLPLVEKIRNNEL